MGRKQVRLPTIQKFFFPLMMFAFIDQRFILYADDLLNASLSSVAEPAPIYKINLKEVDVNQAWDEKKIAYHLENKQYLISPNKVHILEADWRPKQTNISASPNINNFKLSFEVLHLRTGRKYLQISFLVVHRYLKHNIEATVRYPIASGQEIEFNLQKNFGPVRSYIGDAGFFANDYDSGYLFSDENPGIALSGICILEKIEARQDLEIE